MTRRTLPAILAAGAMIAGSQAVAGPNQDAVLAVYLAQAKQADPGFSGFSAARGAAFYRASPAAGDARTPSCTSCHGDDPTGAGQNKQTGKPIEPLAASVNPNQFTDVTDVEKWLKRNCPLVLGRECRVQEKGDVLAFLMQP